VVENVANCQARKAVLLNRAEFNVIEAQPERTIALRKVKCIYSYAFFNFWSSHFTVEMGVFFVPVCLSPSVLPWNLIHWIIRTEVKNEDSIGSDRHLSCN
jgi:hypothetical protein